jgi:hypothetical protein
MQRSMLSRHVCRQSLCKELLRPHVLVVPRSPLQPRHVITRRNAFPHPGKHLFLAFGEPIEIVHKIDQQKFPGQCLGKRRLHAKFGRGAT